MRYLTTWAKLAMLVASSMPTSSLSFARGGFRVEGRNIRTSLIRNNDAWPVGNPEANPTVRRPTMSKRWFSGLTGDVSLRRQTYVEDWTAGMSPKVLPKMCGATLFLYFACLAPVIAFGGALQIATGGNFGIRETILSRGVCGMLYSIFAGQPMTFIGPTGLTLAFTTALYVWVTPRGIPFLPMYAWVGLWTASFLALASAANAANLIRFCTRFTEDVFNAFLGTSYLHTAINALWSRLSAAASAAAAGARGATSEAASALLSLCYGLLTFATCQASSKIAASRYFSQETRSFVADFGPALAVGAVTLLSLSRFSSLLASVPRLAVPASASGFSLGRPLFVPLLTLSWRHRLLAAMPAALLALLFFLDQNITVRTVNSRENHLVRRATYHLDLLVLALLTAGASLCGLPWMCAATVESINHIRSLSSTEVANPSGGAGGAESAGGAEGNGSVVASLSDDDLEVVTEAFESIDKDGSKGIVPSELVGYLRSQPSESSDDKPPRKLSVQEAGRVAVQVYGEFDKDNDGALEFEEFAEWYASAPLADGGSPQSGGGGAEMTTTTTVLETRLSGFAVHALVLWTLPYVSSLRAVPVAVVNGVFMYLGNKVMQGNQMLARTRALAVPRPAALKAESAAELSVLTLGRSAIAAFTGLQLACLGTLWVLKLTPGLGMVFPAAIGLLMLIRVQLLPRLFTRQQLGTVDTPFGSMS